jgi:hypothetical protein
MTFQLLIAIMAIPLLLIPLTIVLTVGLRSRLLRLQREYWQGLDSSREPLPEPPVCPRCPSGMALGHLLDWSRAGLGMATWLEGRPKGLGPSSLDRSIPIMAYRCTRCGYVELYARPELIEKPGQGRSNPEKPAVDPEL